MVSTVVGFRNENARIGLGAFGNIAVIYHFEKLLTNAKTKKWNAINLLLGLFCILFVQQTRMFYMSDAIALIVVFFLCGKTKNARQRNIALALLAIVALIASGLPMQLLSSFSPESTVSLNSTPIRLSAMSYFGQFILEQPWIGIGFASVSLYNELVSGPNGLFYYSDLGLFGVVANMGILGFFIYTLPIFRMCYISFQIFKKRKLTEHALLIALLSYFVTTSISLAYTDIGRTLAAPFVFVLFEYKWKALKRKQTLHTNCGS